MAPCTILRLGSLGSLYYDRAEGLGRSKGFVVSWLQGSIFIRETRVNRTFTCGSAAGLGGPFLQPCVL